MSNAEEDHKVHLRVVLVLILFVSLPISSLAQTMYLVDVRDGLFDTNELCYPNEIRVSRIPEQLLNDSSHTLLQESWLNYEEILLEELSKELLGKRVAVCIHGMAKSYSAANKDLFNNYWNLSGGNGNHFDIVIGISWPGDSRLGISPFFKANRLAKKAGKLLGPILTDWEDQSARMDVITHSMGSKILMHSIRHGDFTVDHAFLLAPSIFRNSVRPWRKWGTECKQINKIVAFHSEYDYAFSWTSMQHLGLGYKGTGKPYSKRFQNYYQVNCSSVINQWEFSRLPKTYFKSRSNHSMYNQSAPVFKMINSALNGSDLCGTRSCELYMSP